MWRELRLDHTEPYTLEHRYIDWDLDAQHNDNNLVKVTWTAHVLEI